MSPPDGRDRAVQCYIAGTVLAALAALVVTVFLADSLAVKDWPLVAGFAVALTLAELRPIHLVHRDESEALQVEEAFFVPMAFLLAPVESLLIVAIAVAITSASWRRGWHKVVFNTAMTVLAFAVGFGVAHTVGIGGVLGPRDVVALLSGGAAYSLTSTLLVNGVISLAQRIPLRELLGEAGRVRIATYGGGLSLGLLVVFAAAQEIETLLLAVVPLIVLQYAYSGALQQWRERRQSEELYEAAARIRTSVDATAVRNELVDAARVLMAAGEARIASVAEAVPQTSLSVPFDDEHVVVVEQRLTHGAWTEADETRLRALTAVASAALENALLYEQLQAITRSLGEGVLALDEQGVITFANPAAEALLGWPEGQLQGRDIAQAVDASTSREGWVHLPRLRNGETIRLDEHVLTRADGSQVDVAMTASPVEREGDVVGAVVAFRDVTDRKALERRLLHQAFHDPLTGLPNRALFLDRLEHARTRKRDAIQAVLFVDLDRFKLINDSLGHRVGDDVLCTVAARMRDTLRDGDTVARFGGDEFTVLLEDLNSAHEASEVAERIVHALRVPVSAGDREVVLSASIGVAVAEPGNAPSDLLAAADIAMYEAKSAGKDRYSIAAADADDRALARLDLEMELRRAIAEGELELHYQPVVRTAGGGLYGFEALVRWRHPTLGLLGPSTFMDLAEDTGLVLPLGDWVLEQACRDAKTWHESRPGSPVVFAVNLSARQFQQPDLTEKVADVVRRSGLDPSQLVLEITETVVMQDTENVLSTLHALRGLRVKLAVDDFGTGFSSLSYLKKFPVDTIKIDKSFIDGLSVNAVDREIVAAVVRLASAVGMHTVAEGVETSGQLDQLRLLGCSAMQGYLISGPKPLQELVRALVPAQRSTTPELRVSGLTPLA